MKSVHLLAGFVLVGILLTSGCDSGDDVDCPVLCSKNGIDVTCKDGSYKISQSCTVENNYQPVERCNGTISFDDGSSKTFSSVVVYHSYGGVQSLKMDIDGLGCCATYSEAMDEWGCSN